MDAQTQIYPYELFVLLEEIHREGFTGTASIAADGGQTVLYVNRGTVRYARTSRVLSTFPAYLLTERVFPKRKVKDYLKQCTETGLSLEQFLLTHKRLAPEDLRHLKRDLARSIFSRAFVLTGTVELKPAERRTPEYRQPVMDPFEAVFRCIAEHPDKRAMSRALEEYGDQRMRRGPDFFALMPTFRNHFGRSHLVGMLDDNPTIDEVREQIGQKGAVVSEIFAMHLAGMVFFESEKERRSPLRRRRSLTDPRLLEEAGGEEGLDEEDEEEQNDGGRRRRTGTSPGPLAHSRMDPDDGSDFRETTPGEDRLEEVTDPGVGSFDLAVPRPRSSSGLEFPESTNPGVTGDGRERSSSNLRDILVGESLLGAADQAERQDYYQFFGIGPMAPFSTLRAAYLAAWSQYGGARFQDYQLTPEGLQALERLQHHIEEGYEVLTNYERRVAHNKEFGLDAEVTPAQLRVAFEAEQMFQEAQQKLSDGANGEALLLLKEASDMNPLEPEYKSYLAWAITCASMWGHPIPGGVDSPERLLKEALKMDPRLESAWIFRARVAELTGDIKGALTAFVYALRTNPDNDEAQAAVERLRAAGVELDPPRKQSLQDRLGSMLGRGDEL